MEVDVLSRLAQMVATPMLLHRNANLSAVVYIAASKCSDPRQFTIDELLASASKIGFQPNRAAIVAKLEDMVHADELASGGQGTFTLISPIEMPTFIQLTEPVWKEFYPEFVRDDPDTELNAVDSKARRAVDQVLTDIFERLANSRIDLAFDFETLPVPDVVEFVKESTMKIGLPHPESFSKVLSTYLGEVKPAFSEFLFRMYQGLINLDMMFRETDLQKVKLSESFDYLLIDTNVLVALLCETHPVHTLASTVCDRTKEAGISMGYTDLTLREMWRLIDASRSEMSTLYTSGRAPLIQSPFAKDGYTLEIPWEEYDGRLLGWKGQLETRWGIKKIVDVTTCDGPAYEYAKDGLTLLMDYNHPDSQHKARTSEAIEHDAHILGHLAISRRSNRTSPIPLPWLLTSDNALTLINERGRKKFEWGAGITIQPRRWLNYLLYYTPIEFDAAQSHKIAEALMRFAAGEKFVPPTLKEYARLVAPKVGLTTADATQLFEALFNHPLRHALESAIKKNQGVESEQLVRDVMMDAPYMIDFVKTRQLREQFRMVGPKMEEKDKRIVTLEQEIEILKARPPGVVINNNVSANANATTNIDLGPLVSILKSLESEGFASGDMPPPPPAGTSNENIRDWLNAVGTKVRNSGLAPALTRLVEGAIGHYLGLPPFLP